MSRQKVTHGLLSSGQPTLDEGFPCAVALAVVGDRFEKLKGKILFLVYVRLLVEELNRQFLLDEGVRHFDHCGPQELVYVWHLLVSMRCRSQAILTAS